MRITRTLDGMRTCKQSNVLSLDGRRYRSGRCLRKGKMRITRTLDGMRKQSSVLGLDGRRYPVDVPDPMQSPSQ